MIADFEKGIKICYSCRKELPLLAFCKCRSKRDGLNIYCRKCENEKKSLRLKENPSVYLKKKVYDRAYHDSSEKKEKRNQRDSQQRRQDPQFQFIEKFRVGLYNAMKENREPLAIVKYLGCSVGLFKKYLKHQFTEGMTWESRGKHIDNWSIDHLIPYNYFDLTIEENRLICCNYLNCEPVWNKKNLSKNAKLIEGHQDVINYIKENIYGNL